MPAVETTTPTNFENVCTYKNCTQEVRANRLCKTHYFRKLRGRQMDKPPSQKGGVTIPNCRTSQEVKDLLDTACRHNDVSLYVLHRRILSEWAIRQKKAIGENGKGLDMSVEPSLDD